MSSLKRTATQADLPMPTSKRASNTFPRELQHVPAPADEPVSTWRWTMRKYEQGVEALAACKDTLYHTLHSWLGGDRQLLPTAAPQRRVANRPRRPIPFPRPSQPQVTAQTSPETPPLTPPSDSNERSSSEPNEAAIPPQPDANVGARSKRIPRSNMRVPKPVWKPSDFEVSKEDRAWFGDKQLRQSYVDSRTRARAYGPPGGIQKPYQRRPHIFDREHKHACQEAMRRQLYEMSTQSGDYSQDYETFKGYLSYRDRISQALGEPLASSTPRTPLSENPPSSSISTQYYPPYHIERVFEQARESFAAPILETSYERYVKRRREERLARDAEIEARKKKDEEAKKAKKGFPASLPPADDAEVTALLKKRGQINTCGKEAVKDSDLARLKPGDWLNDEIMNFYGAMIQQRSDTIVQSAHENGKGKAHPPPDIHVFSSFFYEKLSKTGYENARLGRWTKKIDIFKKDLILFPMNMGGVHWTAGCINFRKKRVEVYDSMNGRRESVYKNLRDYLDKEHTAKKGKPFDFTGWVDYTSPTTPQQQNGFDCGVFSCQFLETLSREGDFAFDQKNMTYLRRMMVFEIGRAKLLPRP